MSPPDQKAQGPVPSLGEGVSGEFVVQRQYLEVRSVYPVEEMERLEQLYPGSTEQMWEAERENRQIVVNQQRNEERRMKALNLNSIMGIAGNTVVSVLALAAAIYALRLGQPWIALGVAAIGVTPALTPYLVGMLWGRPDEDNSEGR